MTHLICLVRPPKCSHGQDDLTNEGNIAVESEDHCCAGEFAAPHKMDLSCESEKVVVYKESCTKAICFLMQSDGRAEHMYLPSRSLSSG